MLSVYSFKNHFLESLLSNASPMFPGAEKLLAVYYENTQGLISKELVINSKVASGITEVTTDQSVHKYRKQHPRSTWLKNFKIEEKPDSARRQLNIHSEYDNHVLLIRFPNAPDGFCDLLFIFFRNEDQIFQFNQNPQKLSTSIKDAVANILVRSLDVFRNQIENDASIFKLINRSDSMLNKEIDLLKERIKNKEQEQIIHFKSFAYSISDPVAQQTGFTFKWSDESILKLVKLQLPFKVQKTIIENALMIVINRAVNSEVIIEIKPIDLVIAEQGDDDSDAPIISIRYERTYQLLDRYEEAAKRVVRDRLSLTGSNLGKYCKPPVSPAAISDALKKHSKKIITLFGQNPNKWSLLRQEFRPVKNMVYKSGMTQYLAS